MAAGGVTFGQYASWKNYGLPYYDGTTVNGLKALRYCCVDALTNSSPTEADGSWLVANKRTQQRTVVMATKIRMSKAPAGNSEAPLLTAIGSKPTELPTARQADSGTTAWSSRTTS